MRVLAFSDLPSGFTFPDVDPDLVLLLGDISYRNVLRIDHQYKCKKIGVLGNHDKAAYFDDTSIINIHRDMQTIDGITFAGFQGSPKYNDKPFGQHLEIEAEAFVSTIYDKPIDIFLAHSNPKYDHISEKDDSHRGFAWNDFQDLKYLFHGHLHDPFVIKKGITEIHSVYPYSLIDIEL